MWHWVLFLGAKNPNRPNIAKLANPDTQQTNMSQQNNFWRTVLNSQAHNQHPIKCLYSGIELCSENFTLDYYVPYDFIGHNHLWNLHPIYKQISSPKPALLPSPGYFDNFIETQFNTLMICRDHLSGNKIAERALNEYSEGLNLDLVGNISKEQFHTAYENLLSPLLTIAQSCGFSSS